MATAPVLNRDPRVEIVDYTWLISGVLYHGGTDKLIPQLQSRGINEVYFHNVAGTPIGKKTVAGVAESFDVEEFLWLLPLTRRKIFLISSFTSVSWTHQIKA